MSAGRCELCGRDGVELTRHHLIPRTRHRNKRTREAFSREELTGAVAMLCRACHRYVHTVLSEKQLEREFNSVARIAEHPDVAKFVEWVRGRPPGLRVRSRR